MLIYTNYNCCESHNDQIQLNKTNFPLILTGTEVITVMAIDSDTKINGQFDLQIVSITPKSSDMEFYLTQIAGTQTGTISFKGCLDHEVRGLIA